MSKTSTKHRQRSCRVNNNRYFPATPLGVILRSDAIRSENNGCWTIPKIGRCKPSDRNPNPTTGSAAHPSCLHITHQIARDPRRQFSRSNGCIADDRTMGSHNTHAGWADQHSIGTLASMMHSP